MQQSALTPKTTRLLQPLRRAVAHAGSVRSTMLLLALLAAVALARPTLVPLALAIALLSANLGAALIVHPLLRRSAALLVAHLALLALVAGIGIGRLVALDGRFELTEGVTFDGTLLDRAAGPLHRPRLATLAFRHEGFEIDYAAGLKRGATRNAVAWTASDGTPRRAVIGDHRPLVLDGHRIYTSSNKGYAPVLEWTPEGGLPVLGAVHLPSYPVHALRQSRAWPLPAGPDGRNGRDAPEGRELWVMLDIDAPAIAAQAASRWRLPERHRLVLRDGEARHVLAPGDAVALAGGRLRYVALRTWMGYRIAYDPTLSWLLAAALVACAAFALHYVLAWRRAPLHAATAAPAAPTPALAGAGDG